MTFSEDLTSRVVYKTIHGVAYKGMAEEILTNSQFTSLHGKVDLIFTSPPFPLNRKKKYGNLQGKEYVDWLANFALLFKNILNENGSIVIEVGNSWEHGSPTMSTLPLESLLAFKDKGNLFLCQQFIYYNPARLPSPAQWVNIERIRVKDSFTTIWWLALKTNPKANNRNVLKEYSDSMKTLLREKKYNSGKRPSEHNIGEKSFLNDNHGAIPSNVLSLSNNQANTDYLKYCKNKSYQPHPARMPTGLPDFFIRFLTNEGDLVLDPFAGSNTTGAQAEKLNRKWVSIEPNEEYILSSVGRFEESKITIADEYE